MKLYISGWKFFA